MRRYRNLASNADGFIAASNLMKSQLVDLGFPAKKIEVIRFGIDLDEFDYEQEFAPASRIMMVGRMVEKKGFCYGLHAIKLLKEWGHNLEIDIRAHGPLQQKILRG
ncbi:MAG: glycosyltransferase [Fodinibius sp.]|nr:glycosyltransferase [Fodinibius sp.]